MLRDGIVVRNFGGGVELGVVSISACGTDRGCPCATCHGALGRNHEVECLVTLSQ